MKIRESLPIHFNETCENTFVGHTQHSTYGLIQTKFCCGLIWLKIGTALQLLVEPPTWNFQNICATVLALIPGHT
jgi:hypothetical protein